MVSSNAVKNVDMYQSKQKKKNKNTKNQPGSLSVFSDLFFLSTPLFSSVTLINPFKICLEHADFTPHFFCQVMRDDKFQIPKRIIFHLFDEAFFSDSWRYPPKKSFLNTVLHFTPYIFQLNVLLCNN